MLSFHLPKRILGGLALMVSLVAALAVSTPAVAQADSSIEIHQRLCPTGYAGDNWFVDCHDTVADPGLTFTFANGVTQQGTTNENGNVGFANLPAGTYTITGGVPGEFADNVVYCAVGTEAESNQSQIPVEYVTGGIQFDLPAATNVICDWYEIPFDLQGGTATETATSAPDTFDMPVFALACDAAPDATAASDFVMLGTAPVGCEQYAGASVSFADQTGATLGACATRATEPCYVNVPVGGSVTASLDPGTIPAGFQPVARESQQVEVPPASEAWTLFVLVPDAPHTATVTETATATEVPEVDGRMVTVHEGKCAPGDPGAIVVELTDLTRPGAAAASDSGVIVAETSTTTIDLTLDELMQSERAIIAYSDEDVPTPVSCTVIGGTLNADGELVIGMQELNDSGITGITYLAPRGNGSQTGVSIFLAEDLVESDAMATPGA